MAYDKSYKEYLENTTTCIFDVDAVLTDVLLTITTSGDFIRTMNLIHGYSLKEAIING